MKLKLALSITSLVISGAVFSSQLIAKQTELTSDHFTCPSIEDIYFGITDGVKIDVYLDESGSSWKILHENETITYTGNLYPPASDIEFDDPKITQKSGHLIMTSLSCHYKIKSSGETFSFTATTDFQGKCTLDEKKGTASCGK